MMRLSKNQPGWLCMCSVWDWGRWYTSGNDARGTDIDLIILLFLSLWASLICVICLYRFVMRVLWWCIILILHTAVRRYIILRIDFWDFCLLLPRKVRYKHSSKIGKTWNINNMEIESFPNTNGFSESYELNQYFLLNSQP